ncbi:MAG: septum site-determining protein MinD [Clostridia bacterium]|nr:septum site-determining protein MinD [Clostridia bacterium]MBP3650126.1 septum site-determining protein MinD [Clostridia bacterium]
MSQSWLILSGKGGVGKTMLTASLGIALAKKNLKCCCVDADIGLRDLDLLLGMENSVVFDMLDVARKDCKLKYALQAHHTLENLTLLPASQNGSSKDLDADTFERIVKKLKKKAGYVLTDAPAGIERGLKNLLPASDYSILVTTPDDVAIRDAERVLALLDEKKKPRPMLVVNRLNEQLAASGDCYTAQTVANTLDVPLLGYIPEDPAVVAAINRHESFMEQDCAAAAAMDRICRRFLGEYVPLPDIRKKRKWFFKK